MSVKRNGPYFLLAAALVVVDQATKALVAGRVALYQSVPVIPGFFNITRIHNKGFPTISNNVTVCSKWREL